MRLAALLIVLLPAHAAAQQVVVSPAPEDVAVTVYRDNNRFEGDQMRLSWLGGYALITETRRVSLPAGTVDIRFEGVAGNIFPQSVILSGLPGLPDEKNYDARLLTPGALVGGALGNQVTIRRTNRVTGEVVEEDAIIRAGPNDIVIQTAAGIEPYQCTGLSETLLYDDVPEGLSDKPTLSVRTRLETPLVADVKLSYLAGQFDWDASYVARLDPERDRMSLFAWMTVANGNEATFEQAQLLSIAGEPNREDHNAPGVDAPSIRLNCWPKDQPPPPPPPPAPMREEMMAMEAGDIVVTGSRVQRAAFDSAAPAMVASQEALGDLKLYRVPEPVTVAANGQKQVAFLVKEEVEVDRVHQFWTSALPYDVDEAEWASAKIILRAENLEKEGLGEPLPAGNVVVFEPVADTWQMVGEDGIENLPVGRLLELELGQSADVQMQQRIFGELDDEDGNRRKRIKVELTVTNARPTTTSVEIPLGLDDDERLSRPNVRVVERYGRKTFKFDVPPTSERVITYTILTRGED